MQNQISKIISFIEDYRTFSNQMEKQKIVYYKTKFEGFLNGYESLNNVIKKFDKKEANDFNIFNILNIPKSEVITHTPFLKNLLES